MATILATKSAVSVQPRPAATWWRERAKDGGVLLFPLVALAAIIARVVALGLITYPGANAGDAKGDYYRYVNMALPNGSPTYQYQDPFVYRILTPGIVHLLSIVGVPFRSGFFFITCLGLTLSTIGIYTLVRGAQQSRAVAMCAALAFVTLQWAVGYNVHDYFLVDPSAQAFMVWILVMAQQGRYLVAALIAAVGVICKESIYLVLALVLVQLLVPYWEPIGQRLRELTQLQIPAIVRRVPSNIWLRWATLLLLPVMATLIVHQILHPTIPLPLLSVWRHYLKERFHGSKVEGLWTTFRLSAWGTYGVLFAWAIAGIALRNWRKAGWTGWALLAAFLPFLYSYAVSGDNERLSINAWPIVIVLAAMGIDAVSQRLRIPALALWVPTIVVQFIYEPATSPNYVGVNNFFGPYAAQTNHWGALAMGGVSGLIAIAAIMALRAAPPPAPLPAVALAETAKMRPNSPANGGSGAEANLPPLSATMPLTTKNPRVQPMLPPLPMPDDTDGRFWMQVSGGVAALAEEDTWIAGLRLQFIIQTTLGPLAAQFLASSSGGDVAPEDPRWQWFRDRWQVGAQSAELWQTYQHITEDYHQIRDRVGIPWAAYQEWERTALRAISDGIERAPAELPELVTHQTLSIVLPAYNEEAIIRETVGDCLRAVRRFAPNAEVIVVDDGSKDKTGVIIDQLAMNDARVVAVHNRPNQGYGGALLAGFAAARGELLFFMDSDNQFDIMGIAPFLQVATQMPGTAVLGYRRNRKDSFMRKLNAWGWKQVVRSQLHVRGIKDIDCAFKLFPTRVIQAIGLSSKGAMINAELLFKLQRMRVPVIQMPVHHYIRTKGQATGANLAVIRRAFRELRQLGAQLRSWQPPTMR